MGTLFQDVRPGDLITAELINRMMHEIERLDTAVAALSVPEGPHIDTLLPSGQLAMGAELQIVGSGFGTPAHNSVTLDGVAALPIKNQSTGNLLVVDVPSIPDVPPQGRQVTVRVSNAVGFDTAPLAVTQAVPTIPSGQLAVTLAQAPAGNLVVGQSHLFLFTVKAITDLQDGYTVTATVDRPGWTAAIVDQVGNPAAAEITIPVSPSPGGTTRTIGVLLTIPSGVAAGTAGKLRLRVASKLNPTGLVGSSGDIALEAGAAPPPPQDKVQVTRGSVLNGAVVGEDVTIAAGAQARVDFNALIKDPGQYSITFSLAGGSAGTSAWRPVLGSPTPFSTGSPNATQTVMVALNPTASAPADTLTVRVQSTQDAQVFGSFSQPIRRT
jgi:hypothetical protein